MRRLCLTLLMGFGLSAAAQAADMPVKAPVAVAPVYNWTGCYLGGNAGYGWGRDHYTFVPVLDEGSHSLRGFVGGGQIGCDYQFASNWVIGIQGMFDGAAMRGDHNLTTAPPINDETRVRWFGTATGRIGYLVAPTALLYAKAGGAWLREDYNESFLGTFRGAASTTRSGWTIGGGLEWMFARNWSVFVEYDYFGLGTKRLSIPGPIAGPNTYDIKQDINVVLIGLNYRFGGL